ncbi:hypothetical protein J2X50_003081 [Aminobacter sp. BE322]
MDADSWDAGEIPLGEEREEYRIDVASVDGSIVRSTNVSGPGWTYAAAEIVADFGTPPTALDVAVRQFSVAAGWGLPATRRLALA